MGVTPISIPQVCAFGKTNLAAPIRLEQRSIKLMSTRTLRGPFALIDREVDRQVTRTSAGAYALNRGGSSGTFYVHYVGRSDVDINGRLKAHVGNYRRFMFEYCPSPKAAFEQECGLYHDFTPSDNLVHPARPAGSTWRCPRCSLFG